MKHTWFPQDRIFDFGITCLLWEHFLPQVIGTSRTFCVKSLISMHFCSVWFTCTWFLVIDLKGSKQILNLAVVICEMTFQATQFVQLLRDANLRLILATGIILISAYGDFSFCLLFACFLLFFFFMVSIIYIDSLLDENIRIHVIQKKRKWVNFS